MARFIDDLRGKKLGKTCPLFETPLARSPEPEPEGWTRYAQLLKEKIQSNDLPVVLVDNVAEYSAALNKHTWSWTDTPNLAPPYPEFWCEYSSPRALVREGRPMRFGLLVQSLEPSDRVRNLDPSDLGIEEVKWVLAVAAYVDHGHPEYGPTWGPSGLLQLLVGPYGRASESHLMNFFPESDGKRQNHAQFVFGMANPVFLAISFMHCANVIMRNNRVDAPLAKKYHARYGVAPVEYKTLVIEPLKSILAREGQVHEVGLATALHVCRGHFKDYRKGPGLFAKIHQLVWQPTIVRGTKGKHAPPREIEIHPPRIGF